MTTAGHLSSGELELYVLDALGPAARLHLERHVSVCAACARSLAAEAALEMALGQLWPEVRCARRPLAAVVPLRRAARPVPARRVQGRAPLGGLAAAAMAVLFIGWWSDGARFDSRVPSAVIAPPACAAPPVEGATDLCVAEASPAPGALASWAACAPPAPAFAGLCGRRSSPGLLQ
jgi:anti-sigma factor RsiW